MLVPAEWKLGAAAGGAMDTLNAQPPNLATRLRRARVDERVAELLATVVGEELGVNLLRDQDADAARRLTELVEIAARRTGPCAVNKFAVELLELLLDEAPQVRQQVARPRPELARA